MKNVFNKIAFLLTEHYVFIKPTIIIHSINSLNLNKFYCVTFSDNHYHNSIIAMHLAFNFIDYSDNMVLYKSETLLKKIDTSANIAIHDIRFNE